MYDQFKIWLNKRNKNFNEQLQKPKAVGRGSPELPADVPADAIAANATPQVMEAYKKFFLAKKNDYLLKDYKTTRTETSAYKTEKDKVTVQSYIKVYEYFFSRGYYILFDYKGKNGKPQFFVISAKTLFPPDAIVKIYGNRPIDIPDTSVKSMILALMQIHEMLFKEGMVLSQFKEDLGIPFAGNYDINEPLFFKDVLILNYAISREEYDKIIKAGDYKVVIHPGTNWGLQDYNRAKGIFQP